MPLDSVLLAGGFDSFWARLWVVSLTFDDIGLDYGMQCQQPVFPTLMTFDCRGGRSQFCCPRFLARPAEGLSGTLLDSCTARQCVFWVGSDELGVSNAKPDAVWHIVG